MQDFITVKCGSVIYGNQAYMQLPPKKTASQRAEVKKLKEVKVGGKNFRSEIILDFFQFSSFRIYSKFYIQNSIFFSENSC
jgi:hypothetical protein